MNSVGRRLQGADSATPPKEHPLAQVHLGIGANLGDPLRTLRETVESLKAHPCITSMACTSFYRTEPIGIGATGTDYLNAVIYLETSLPLMEFFAFCQALEKKAGRERPYPNAPRTLDIDLLFAKIGQNPVRSDSPFLTLPHPRIAQRAFVLVPWIEIAGAGFCPGSHLSLGELLSSCSVQRIEKLSV